MRITFGLEQLRSLWHRATGFLIRIGRAEKRAEKFRGQEFAYRTVLKNWFLGVGGEVELVVCGAALRGNRGWIGRSGQESRVRRMIM